jgi:nucleotide-binding universal stress UspA family protein
MDFRPIRSDAGLAHDSGVRISRVVVGVDGSPQSRHALRWAADEAHRHDATLVAVMAWHYPAIAFVPMSPGGLTSSDTMQAATERALARVVEEELGSTPNVHVEQIAPWSGASEALIDQIAPETLLVIGHRERSMMREILLGSTSRATIRRATCPVAVLDGGGGDERDRSADPASVAPAGNS